MPLNEQVAKLMGWHPSADAGVRIPFREGVRPLEGRIETALITRLRLHALELSQGADVPRIILLVGGSGNGKTDAIEDYVEALDRACNANQALLRKVSVEFEGEGPLPAWLVRFDASALDASNAKLARIGELSILQDASASADPAGDAASLLADVLDQAVRAEGTSLMLACVNRGLLSRVLRRAAADPAKAHVVSLTRQVALACSEVVQRDNPPACWPLTLPADHPLQGKVAVWPLDIESLLVSRDGSKSVLDQVLDVATAQDRWEEGQCGGCPHSPNCPFFENARALRDPTFRDSLARLLRDFEIATGARWTFRQVFGLAAELIVGHPAIFGSQHPCDWVGERSEQVAQFPGAQSDSSLLALVRRLYFFVLFPFSPSERATAAVIAGQGRASASRVLEEELLAFLEIVALAEPPGATHLQQRISQVLAPRFDPAEREPAWLAGEVDAVAERIFEACDVNVDTGASVAASEIEIPGLVLTLIKRMSECEDGIDSMQRSSTLPRDALALLRSLASALLARIAGSQRASYPLRKLVASYEESARNPAGLRKLARREFPRLISPDGKLRFGFLETLENLPLSASRAFTLVSSKDLDANPGAIVESPARPATQLPFIYLQGVRNVPLTFDLFLALRERENKRDASSESASIRAAVGQLRVLLAGAVGRSKQGFEEYKHWYEVGATHEIHLDAAGNPGLTDKEER